MDYHEWEPHYMHIVKEFGFSIEDDERSARDLEHICRGKVICRPECLARLIGGEVTILGDGPELERTLLSENIRGTLIAADGATSKALHVLGRVPEIIVTDLDGDVLDQLAASAQGAVSVILAHGDNRENIERYVPWFSGPITPTVQGRPFEGLYNFGGFTDGDRAVMLARHFCASRIHLLGFDLDRPRPKAGRDEGMKRRKLAVARDLIWNLNPSGVEIIVH